MHLDPQGPILVIGPGAVGTLVAARLATAGHDAVLAARDAVSARALAAGLVAVDPAGREIRASVPVVWRRQDLAAAPRMLVLATKCADAEAALAAWLPGLAEHAPVVAMQNGILGDRLKPLAGERLVECTVSFPATLDGPGRSLQTAPGDLHLGPWPRAGPRDDPSEFKAVARVLSDVAPVTGSSNMLGVKWTKLAINSCITSLGVVAGQPLREILQDRKARRIFLAIFEEAYAAGRADGVRFERIGRLRAGMFGRRWPGRDPLLRIVARGYGRHRSSSLQSLERGRRTEIDWLNGHIVAAARRHGADAPVNAAVVALVHDIEAGLRAPDPANLAALPV
ncbi:MAG: ketopantoate reductase family protein [Candidatus Thermoplasmatota archaeon]